jgi:RNA polymerase sigma factor for flagellar operon FliA
MVKKKEPRTPEQRQEEYEMWVEYKKRPTVELQKRIIKQYTPMVHKIASAFIYKRPNVLDYDDLISAGMLGLLNAIEKYDPDNERKAQFHTFATFRVRGAILDEINSMDWTPRSVRKDIKEIINSIEAHYQEHQQEPTVEQLAEKVDKDQETTRSLLNKMQKTYILQVEHETLDLSQSTDFERDDMRRTISLTMEQVLTAEEKSYIVLFYFNGYSHKEIQAMLDWSTTDAKNVRASALSKLSIALEDSF